MQLIVWTVSYLLPRGWDGLVERDTGRVGSRFRLLQGSGDVSGGIAPGREVIA